MNLLNLFPSDAANDHANRRLDDAQSISDCLLANIPGRILFAYFSYLLLRKFGCADPFSRLSPASVPFVLLVLAMCAFNDVGWIKARWIIADMASFGRRPATVNKIKDKSRNPGLLSVKGDHAIASNSSEWPKQTLIRVMVVDGRDEPIEFAARARLDSTHRCSPVTAVLGRDRSQQRLGPLHYIKRASELT